MENHTKTSWSSDNLSVSQILGKSLDFIVVFIEFGMIVLFFLETQPQRPRFNNIKQITIIII